MLDLATTIHTNESPSLRAHVPVYAALLPVFPVSLLITSQTAYDSLTTNEMILSAASGFVRSH